MNTRKINIMTSSDERLLPQLKVQMEAISRNLPTRDINFFLFHDGKARQIVESLYIFAENYANLRFFDAVIEQPDMYNILSASGGAEWGGAAYYSLCAYQYLPPEIDRILYLDAGDTLVIDNIDKFYFSDFHGRSLLAMPVCFKDGGGYPVLFGKDDLFDRAHTARVLRGLFNSGSYVINLEKFRIAGLTIEDYLEFAKALRSLTGKETNAYWGDQGFLSALFVGDIQFFSYPEIKNLWYMPYNFCLWYFDRMIQKVDYKPCILHYAGVSFKPWYGAYPIFCEHFQERDKLRDLNELKLGQAEYYYLWHEYAMLAEQRKQGEL